MTVLLKSPSENLWLIGTGYMGLEYAKVLLYLKKAFLVIGRNKLSAKKFQNEIGLSPKTGGLSNALKNNIPPKVAILAVSVEELFHCTKQLILNGCKKILVEKPVGITLSQIEELVKLKNRYDVEIFVAYNRRFFKSVYEVKEKIQEENGISSLNFEFTEFGFKLKNNKKFNKDIMKRWLIANSSHVIDLVFFLIGTPNENEFKCFQSGESVWHKPTKFHGAGISCNDIPFSYKADWEAPGRWGIEILTKFNLYILSPMEELHCIKLGEFERKKINLKKSFKDKFKSGLLDQCECFFLSDKKNLCTIDTHFKHFKYYIKIAGY
tara:strand:+ start:276 stop:1244 length:969 start_codon:yes stop_codon:yes gene_type:complete